MGIYDRDYYRREGPSFLDSFNAQGFACKWIVISNVIVFVLQLAGGGLTPRGGLVEQWFQLDTQRVFSGEIWRLVTYAFLHDPNSIWHILFNMLVLWWFGIAMEDIYGTREFFAMYMTAALVAGIGFVVPYCWPDSYGIYRPGYAIGASGAVSAVMVLYALHYPTRIIYLYILPIPVWAFVVFSVGRDLIGAFGGPGSGIAFTAHLAGAAFAFVYYHWNLRITEWLPDTRKWMRQRARPNVRIYHEPPPSPVAVPASGPPPEMGEEQLEAKLDAVLEKVARLGKDSLTEGEQQILLRASEIYKRRRS